MKQLFFTIALLGLLQARGGNRYTLGQTTGGAVLSPASATGFTAGDTLYIKATANFDAVSYQNLNGTAAKWFVIRFLPGSVITTDNTGYAGVIFNCSFVKIIGANFRNYAGICFQASHYVHDIILERPSIINDYGRYSKQYGIIFDRKSNKEMLFDGTKKTTFYNVEIDGATLNGFMETNGLIMGSDTSRSICTDFYIHNSTFKNFTNRNHQAAIPIEGTCFNQVIENCRFDSIMADVGAYQGVHAAAIQTYGWGQISGCVFSYEYASAARINPLTWPGLGGTYQGSAARWLVYNNLVHNQLSYSAFEASNNNSTPRIKALGCDTAESWFYNNVVFGTLRASYNGDYRGYGLDVITHNVKSYSNYIIDPERDRPYDPVFRDNYANAFISGRQPGFDSLGNYLFHTAAEAGLDTVKWVLLPGSPICKLQTQNMKKLLFLPALFLCVALDSQTVQQKQFVVDAAGTKAWGIISVPAGTGPFPVWAFAPGDGEKGNGTQSTLPLLYNNGSPLFWMPKNILNPVTGERKDFIVVGMQGVNGSGISPDQYGYLLTNDVLKNYPADKNNVTISGLSLGGALAWSAVAGKYASLYRFAVPMSTPTILASEVDWSTVTAKVWSFHGKQDAGLTDYYNSVRFRDAVNSYHPGFAHLTSTNTGHGPWAPYFDTAYREAFYFTWDAGKPAYTKAVSTYQAALAAGSGFYFTAEGTTPIPVPDPVTRAQFVYTMAGDTIKLDPSGTTANGAQSYDWFYSDTLGNYKKPDYASGPATANGVLPVALNIKFPKGYWRVTLTMQDRSGFKSKAVQTISVGQVVTPPPTPLPVLVARFYVDGVEVVLYRSADGKTHFTTINE